MYICRRCLKPAPPFVNDLCVACRAIFMTTAERRKLAELENDASPPAHDGATAKEGTAGTSPVAPPKRDPDPSGPLFNPFDFPWG